MKLQCFTRGGPDNIYSWFLNGVELSENDFTNITSSDNDKYFISRSRLTIGNIDSITNQGAYRCVVSNDEGTGEASVVVTG